MTTVHRTKHILDLNPLFIELREKLRALTDDPTPFMRGQVHLSGAELAPKPSLLQKRPTKPSPNNDAVATYLKYGLHKSLVCLEQVKPELSPGGRYANSADAKLRSQLASVPTTNRRNESTFGKLNNTMRDCRRMQTINIAAQIKAQQNGTSEWVRAHPEQQKIVRIDMKTAVIFARKEKEREIVGLAKCNGWTS
jgi:hypothetical protein